MGAKVAAKLPITHRHISIDDFIKSTFGSAR
jgi:hypothetical protein